MSMSLRTSLSGWMALCFASCASTGQHGKVVPAQKVDLSRYMGPWRVIACMDNPVERDFVDAVETYRRRPDGKIAVHFEWRDKRFDAPVKTHDFTGRVLADGTNARWKMRLFPLFTASYIIVKVDPEYSRVAVAHPSRKFGWILARERSLPSREYEEMVNALEEQGYETSKLVRVPQRPSGPR
jgi:apolipoprotein D and lipocalin family protein